MPTPPQVVEIHEEKLWEEFCASATPTTFFQSWHWGEIHRALGRKIWRLAAAQDDAPVAVGLLVKHTSRFGDHLYCPRGPLCDWTDLAALDAFLARAREIAVAERCAFVRLDPLLPERPEHRALFAARGFVSALTVVMAEDVRLLALGPSEDALLRAMRKTTRYLIRQERARGIHVSVSTDPEAARAFVDLLYATGKRKGFIAHPPEHYLTMFEVLSAKGLAEVLIARHGADVLATAVIVYYADTAYYLYAASRAVARGSCGYQLQWEAITRAKRRGCRYYNFLGIARAADLSPGHPLYGISIFKRGFGGFEYTYLRTQDLPVSRRYWLYRYAEKGRRVLRRARRRIARLV